MRTRWLSLALALLSCAGDEISPLPYYGDAASPGAAGMSGGSGQSGASGSAGAAGAIQPGAVLINEVDPGGDPVDWVELKNRGSAPVDLAGWFIAQGYDGATPPAEADRLVLPSGTYLQPGAYLVVYTRKSDGPGPGDFGVGKDAPERLSLFDPAGQLADDTTTDGSPGQPLDGVSWGRLPDGEGPFTRTRSTRDASNLAP